MNRRLNYLAAFFLVLSLFPIILEFTYLKRVDSQIYKGDFPAFYSAAVIAKTDPTRLYDFDFQSHIQNEFWPSLGGNYHAFVYPASFAYFLSPLANFTPAVAKVIYVVFQFLCFLAAFYLAKSYIKNVKDYFPYVLIAAFSFLPFYSSLLGGQNTALSFLLLSATAYFMQRGGKYDDYLAGFFLGLWFFKPQLALFLCLQFLIFKRFKIFFASLLGLLIHFSFSTIVVGRSFLAQWKEALETYVPVEAKVNSHQMVSIPGVFSSLSENLQNPQLLYFGYCLSLILLLIFYRRLFSANKEFSLTELFFSVLVFLLISPHALYYDLSLSLFALLIFLDFTKSYDRLFLISFFLFAAIFSISKQGFIYSPLVFLLLFSFFWMLRRHKKL